MKNLFLYCQITTITILIILFLTCQKQIILFYPDKMYFLEKVTTEMNKNGLLNMLEKQNEIKCVICR